ncbi:MAG: Fe-S cluster assembly protein SufD [Marine Group III euryarchaeote CG-Epi3]|uniref:Fe-S cluster assembly protein SufD n=1 Tax=Marine Group III euryarchaeote CG-Epi3 TaxID=1888997 RepID=A0A1J5UBT9_9ARCH|nr:MAG: Fe-S cluster assembly protein SufD [Marine Group III euryarchaeote CG-Epi3]
MKVLDKISADFDNSISKETESIKNIRIDNFTEFKKMGIPTSKEEFWKYTDPSIINDSEFILGDSEDIEDEDYDIIIVNGKLVKKIEGMQNTDVRGSLSEEILDSSHFLKTKNAFVNLNNAFLTDGCVINFEKDCKKEINILNLVNNTKSEQIIHPRIIIKAGKNSNISILEEIRFSGKIKNLVNSVTNFYLEEGANVEHVIIDDFSEETYQISNVLVKQKKDSIFSSYNYSNAKKLVRKDFIVELKERGSHCDLRGVYLADKDNHIDHHTIIEHEEEHCTSNELYKGILSGKSTGVFNGRIHVHNAAQKTDAIQSNQNILLSDNAIIHTKPELEIYADDVKCTHGATVGQLDEKGIFYLRARGIKRKDAQKMMMRAYVGEVLTGIKNDTTKNTLLEKIIANIPDGDE